MLTREQNWQKEEEQYETARISDPEEISKYYEELEKYTERMNCEAFDCKVIYAFTNELQYKRKSTVLRSEVLHLICRIDDTNYWFEVSIFGRTKAFSEEKKEWGEWGKNGNALNDVMEIIAHQKPNYLENYHVSFDFDERDIYPHICGTHLKVLGTVVELKTSAKGKLYDKTTYAVFDPQGFSGWELKMGIKDRLDYRKAFANFKELYLNFCEEQGIPPREFGVKKPVETPKEEVKEPVKEVVQEEPQRMVNSMNAFTGMTEEAIDDDLPF